MARWIEAYGPENILDVGCGYGRIYQYLRKSYNGPITMCDFVDSFRARCEKVTGILPDKWDGHTLPYNDNAFDLVLSFSVLNHVPVEDLDPIFSEHVRVAAKWVYVRVGLPARSKGKDFRHDYLALFEEHNMTVLRNRTTRHTQAADWWLGK